MKPLREWAGQGKTSEETKRMDAEEEEEEEEETKHRKKPFFC
jgi:hypothetical protein